MNRPLSPPLIAPILVIRNPASGNIVGVQHVAAPGRRLGGGHPEGRVRQPHAYERALHVALLHLRQGPMGGGRRVLIMIVVLVWIRIRIRIRIRSDLIWSILSRNSFDSFFL